MDKNTLDQFQSMDLVIELSEDLQLTKFISSVFHFNSSTSGKQIGLRDLPIPEPSLSSLELILSSMKRELKFLGDIPFVQDKHRTVFSIIAYKPEDHGPISLFGHHLSNFDTLETQPETKSLTQNIRFELSAENEFTSPDFLAWLGISSASVSLQSLMDYVVYESDRDFLNTIHQKADASIQKQLFSVRIKGSDIHTLDLFFWKTDATVHGFISESSINLAQAGMLSAQQANLQAVLNSINDSFVLVGSDLKILLANENTIRNSQKLMGKQLRIGDSIMNFMAEGKRSAFLQNFAKALEGQAIEFEEELNFANGISRWFHIRYLPIYDSNKHVI